MVIEKSNNIKNTVLMPIKEDYSDESWITLDYLSNMSDESLLKFIKEYKQKKNAHPPESILSKESSDILMDLTINRFDK
ncbi:MAG: hypothetical protein GWP06_00395 [Actinobacteria bacterium]|nr:hypothetical protein [Actinomycetota bacterium]